jgi:hypothetical protein
LSRRALCAAAALVALAAAVEAEAAAGRRPWYAPDQLKLQFAGNVGFLSPGVGYAWSDRRVEADLFFGWVPRAVGGEDIVSFTAKLTWLPWALDVGRRWLVRPFSAGVQTTYTLGDDYFMTLPSRYRPHYYDFPNYPTALRAGVAFGGALGRKGSGTIREIAVYAELVALDTMLVAWARNREALGLADVFSLALGVRLAL